MPLIKSAKKKAMSENIEKEMDAGKPRAQSIAIAYSTKRQAMKKNHKMARGGEMRDSDMAGMSLADQIIRKKKMMAEGGEVDLDHNSDEDLNLEDKLSFDAARKHTYYDDDQLSEQPEDSNEHGDDLSDEDLHDMVSAIRKKMKSRGM